MFSSMKVYLEHSQFLWIPFSFICRCSDSFVFIHCIIDNASSISFIVLNHTLAVVKRSLSALMIGGRGYNCEDYLCRVIPFLFLLDSTKPLSLACRQYCCCCKMSVSISTLKFSWTNVLPPVELFATLSFPSFFLFSLLCFIIFPFELFYYVYSPWILILLSQKMLRTHLSPSRQLFLLIYPCLSNFDLLLFYLLNSIFLVTTYLCISNLHIYRVLSSPVDSLFNLLSSSYFLVLLLVTHLFLTFHVLYQ